MGLLSCVLWTIPKIGQGSGPALPLLPFSLLTRLQGRRMPCSIVAAGVENRAARMWWWGSCSPGPQLNMGSGPGFLVKGKQGGR